MSQENCLLVKYILLMRVSNLSKKRQEEGKDDISVGEALDMSNWNPTTPEDNFVDQHNFGVLPPT